MLPCHSCYIYGIRRSKEVRGLKSPYGGKRRQVTRGGSIFMWEELTRQLVYLNYLA